MQSLDRHGPCSCLCRGKKAVQICGANIFTESSPHSVRSPHNKISQKRYDGITPSAEAEAKKSELFRATQFRPERKVSSRACVPIHGPIGRPAGYGCYWQALWPLDRLSLVALLLLLLLLLLLRRPYPNRINTCITATRPRCRPAHFPRIRW